MRPTQDNAWDIGQSARLYGIAHWGDGYFGINGQGHVCVRPSGDSGCALDLYAIAQSLHQRRLSLPVLVRFTDILQDRVRRLQAAFGRAAASHGYQGRYTPVYPIKVNQQRQVVAGILAAGGIGLEAGSKPELLAIMALSKDGVVVCNGYKDRAYIRLALIGLRLGLDLHLVIEKPLELEYILDEAAKLGIRPQLGVRVRLSSISAGKWQNSGGEKSKFGLNAFELLQLVTRLKQAGRLDCLRLMHFHMGSQIANIHDIKVALQEAGRFYAELRRLGADIRIVDAGGGLGVDYDGSRSRRDSSINYTLDEYAHNIIRSFADLCREQRLPHPDVITESGRALTAHHAVLITNVTDIEAVCHGPAPEAPLPPAGNITELYHDAQFELSAARARFVGGQLDLAGLARAEGGHAARCQQLKRHLDPEVRSEAAILAELDEKLADKMFCNFSLFQSLPDIWGIDQVFPIMPIHRLDERPTRRAILQDLTCDSDGSIEQYLDGQNIVSTLAVHAADGGDYLLGFFMVGAYQEILGDMHNLFGDTHAINIVLDGDGYQFHDLRQGEHVSDLLDYVHISVDELKGRYREKLASCQLSDGERQAYEQELLAGLDAYTYLEK